MARTKRDRADVLIERLTLGRIMAPAGATAAGHELVTLLHDDVDTMLVCAPLIEPRHPDVALEMHEAIVASKPETLATVMAVVEYLRICRSQNDAARAGRLLPRAIALAAASAYPQLHEQLDALRADPAFASLFGD